MMKIENCSHARCPFCGLSDGNDDRTLKERFFHEGNDLKCEQLRQCDICGRIYEVEQVYNLKYEKATSQYEWLSTEITC